MVPCTAVGAVLQARADASSAPDVVWWTLALSGVLGLAAWILRAGTPAAAAIGALLTASIILSTATGPFAAWRSAIVPILAFMVLTSLATRYGREQKLRLGTAEAKHGRGASQVAANLGIAALILTPVAQFSLIDNGWFSGAGLAAASIVAPALAALAEAAADTVSSELGQVLGGRPVMLTTFRRVDPGTDGAISLAGTLAGVTAAAAISAAGMWAFALSARLFVLSWIGGVFGLFFDSLLGATLERGKWINNDAVNFLSTASSAACTLALLAVASHSGVR